MTNYRILKDAFDRYFVEKNCNVLIFKNWVRIGPRCLSLKEAEYQIEHQQKRETKPTVIKEITV